MRFPPPIRITAPLLALAVGLAATFFEYRLNLDLDLARHLAEVRQSADSNGRRLARLSEDLLPATQPALQADLEGMMELPQFEIAGVVDENGRILADSTGTLHGKLATATRLAKAAALITPTGEASVRHGEDARTVLSAHPFRLGTGATTGWVLLELDRTAAIAATKADARTQLAWMASAMALLSFALWAVLHFGFAARLGRLADSMRALGEGRADAAVLPSGSDEVGKVSAAFTAMAARLREREAEQLRLEREVLEISEGERRRIGQDLHDGLGQQLTAASMTTNALIGVLKTDASALAERGEDIGRQLREAIAETRSLSHGLAPVALVDDGLMSALGLLAEGTKPRWSGPMRFRVPEPRAHGRCGGSRAPLPHCAGGGKQRAQARRALRNPHRPRTTRRMACAGSGRRRRRVCGKQPA